MSLYEFANKQPDVVVWLSFLAFGLLSLFGCLLYNGWKRFVTHLNIRKAGWPPPHLDAEGDFKPEPIKEEE